jgi:DNA mismatch repair protein MutL
MSNKIHILSPELANKIAAGEVVQRPASVVKELVENALDANATRISVLVKDAGKVLIQVVDNGDGMSEMDASLAFRRHATSKIKSPSDLEAIKTLGFRGEALAAISAVSQVEVKTKIESDDLATFIRIEGDEVKEKSKTAFERGTSITIRNLFYNTPARRNFLKTRQTELKNITDVVVRMAVAYPDVEWFYASDDDTLIDVKKEQIEQRISHVFGKAQGEGLVRFEETTDLMHVSGFLAKPNFARKTRSEQYVFLNGRFIFSKMINHAVFQAYEHLLEKGSYPFFLLFLTVDPSKVDVNVHPTKMEVKFENDSNIYRLVLSAVRKALAANDLVPLMSIQDGNAISSGDSTLRFDGRPWEKNEGTMPASAPVFSLTQDFHSAESRSTTAPIIGKEEVLSSLSGAPSSLQFQTPPGVGRILAQHQTEDVSQESKPVWQLHNKYIISQIRSGLMIVDQHVAHERILYERVIANFENSLPSSQQLLFPETVELPASDYAMVKELQPHLEKLGFDLKLFGKNTIVIEGIPADVRVGSEKKILQDVLDEYKNNEHAGISDVRDNLAKSFACKAAIKAGDKLNTTEMIVLIEHLFLTKMPYVCPHGRPIVVRIPLEELDKRFGRT